jgi:hypothetical protein
MAGALGIMTHYFHGPSKRLRALSQMGHEVGFDPVLVYTPKDVDLKNRQIKGSCLKDGHWVSCITKFPAVNHDIGYYSRPETIRKVRQIKYQSTLEFTAYSLGNKWTLHKQICTSDTFKKHLLPTAYFEGIHSIIAMLEKYQTVMIKPLNGKGGKEITKLSKLIQHTGYALINSDKAVNYIPQKRILGVLHQLTKGKKYIIQRWVDIRSIDNQVFDIRTLAQKNHQGEWITAGFGVREGGEQAITSNLASGGQPLLIQPYLNKQFSAEQAAALYTKIEDISTQLPSFLEQCYGRRFAELGIDLAIDRTGELYILEVNIKPGTALFRKLYSAEVYKTIQRRPIDYAAYLTQHEINKEPRSDSS